MITFIFSETPDQPSARHGLDMLLMALTLEENASALFIDKGIWQLVTPQESPDPIKKIALLNDVFEFQNIYTTRAALEHSGLTPDQFRFPVSILDAEEVNELLQIHSHHRLCFGDRANDLVRVS